MVVMMTLAGSAGCIGWQCWCRCNLQRAGCRCDCTDGDDHTAGRVLVCGRNARVVALHEGQLDGRLGRMLELDVPVALEHDLEAQQAGVEVAVGGQVVHLQLFTLSSNFRFMPCSVIF